MGCDIHCYAEVLKNGIWKKVGDVFPASQWEMDYYHKELSDRPIRERNYAWFGFLANVRNTYDLPTVAKQRDIPNNVSKEVCELNKEFGDDGHSHSWLLLSELLAFDYDKTVRLRNQEAYTLRAIFEPEWFEILDRLSALGKPTNVRIVFWFDNNESNQPE